MVDVPLICDPLPGGFMVIECDEKLSVESAARVGAYVNEAITAGKVLVLDKGFRIKRVGGPAEWPDAEYCAA